MDRARKAAAQKLLDAAYKFWQACNKEGQFGAVQWLQDTNGRVLIFTRGEYRAELLAGVERFLGDKVHHFIQEHIPADDVCETCSGHGIVGSGTWENAQTCPDCSGTGFATPVSESASTPKAESTKPASGEVGA